jgi:hypothetical protein
VNGADGRKWTEGQHLKLGFPVSGGDCCGTVQFSNRWGSVPQILLLKNLLVPLWSEVQASGLWLYHTFSFLFFFFFFLVCLW